MPVQIVIDTNVLVAAARSNAGASFELFRGDFRDAERFGLKVLAPAEFLKTL